MSATQDGAVFRLPDLGEGMRDAEIVAWLVSAGDRVVADQPLLTIETDKAVVDVPSPRAGTIAALHGEPGTRVPVGAVLVEFAGAASADRGAVVGELPGAPPSAGTPAVAQEPPAAPTPPAAPPPAERAPAPGRAGRVAASPAVRALARRLGVDLEQVPPTGRRGEVTVADVEAATPSRRGTIPTAGGEAPSATAPLRGVRRAMADRMARARDEVAPATVVDDADISDWESGHDVMLRLLRAIASGARAEPALNATYDAATESVTRYDAVRAGVAVDAPDGLFVVVVGEPERPPAQLRRELDALEQAVRDRTIAPEQMRGATLMLSNFGTLAGRYAHLVLPPPAVAILGAGRAAERPAVHDGAIVARRLLPLSLTFDHRVVTGGEAARFLRAVIDDLEQTR